MKKLLRLIIPVLVFAIAGGIFMMNKMTARADVDNSTDPPTLNIGAGDYWEDQEMGGYLFVIARDNYEPSTNTFTVYDGQHNPLSTCQLGNITVPSGCTLAIDALLDETTNAWTFNSSYTGTITVEDGGCLAIFGATVLDNTFAINIADGGSMNLFGATVPNTVINPSDGASIGIETGYSGFPTGGFTGYHWDGQTQIAAEENINDWIGLAYDGTSSRWVWDDFPMGDPGLVADCRCYLFAYTAPPATDDLRILLATELYNKFFDVNMRGFDWYSTRGSRDANIESIRNIIELSAAPSQIPVQKNDGTNDTRDYYTATVHWGIDEQGTPVDSTIPVFVLSSTQEFLVCTDQNYTTGMGTNYFVRTTHVDKTVFADGSGTFGTEDMEEYAILTNNVGNVVIGGDGLSVTDFNTDGMYSAQATKMPVNISGIPGDSYNALVRVLNSSDTYIAVIGDGEPKNTDGMGLNGVPTDNIWETGENASARVFIGYSTLYIEPLNQLAGYGFNAITDVALMDETQRDGVEIDKSDLTHVRVTFRSNFYDSVPLQITYTGGVVKTLIINRIGLVIRYLYLAHDQSVGTISCDCYQNSVTPPSFSYNYAAGEQILVFATYYHPTNYTTAGGDNDLYLNLQFENGTQRIIGHTDAARGFNGYIQSTANAVATTTFIIDIINGGNQTSVTYPTFYATVMNAGFNDDTTYGGTQTGSGKGVYWNGQMYWMRRGL